MDPALQGGAPSPPPPPVPESELLTALRAGDIDRATAVLREQQERAVADLSILETVFPIALSSLAESYDLHGVTGNERSYFQLARELHRFMPEAEREIPDMLCTFLYAGAKFNQAEFVGWVLPIVARHPSIDLPSLVADRMYEYNSLRHSAIYYVAKNGSVELYDMLASACAAKTGGGGGAVTASAAGLPPPASSPLLLEARVFDRLMAAAVSAHARPPQPTPESVALSSLPAAPSETGGGGGGAPGAGGGGASGGGGSNVMKRPEEPDPPALYTSLKAGHTRFLRHALSSLPPSGVAKAVRTLVTHALIPLDDADAARALYAVVAGRAAAAGVAGGSGSGRGDMDLADAVPLLDAPALLSAFALGRDRPAAGVAAVASAAHQPHPHAPAAHESAAAAAGTAEGSRRHSVSSVGSSQDAAAAVGIALAAPLALTASGSPVRPPSLSTASASSLPPLAPLHGASAGGGGPPSQPYFTALHFCAFVSETSAEAHLVRWPPSARYAQWLLATFPVAAVLQPLPRVRWSGLLHESLPLAGDHTAAPVEADGGAAGAHAAGAGASAAPPSALASAAPHQHPQAGAWWWSGWSPMASAAAAGALELAQVNYVASAPLRAAAAAAAATTASTALVPATSGRSSVPGGSSDASGSDSGGEAGGSPNAAAAAAPTAQAAFADPLTAPAVRIAAAATVVHPIRVAVKGALSHRRFELVAWLAHLLPPSALDAQLYAPSRHLYAARPDFVKTLCKRTPLSLRAMKQGGAAGGGVAASGPGGGGGSGRLASGSNADAADAVEVELLDDAVARVLGANGGDPGSSIGSSMGRSSLRRARHPPALPQGFGVASAGTAADVTAGGVGGGTRKHRSGTSSSAVSVSSSAAASVGAAPAAGGGLISSAGWLGPADDSGGDDVDGALVLGDVDGEEEDGDVTARSLAGHSDGHGGQHPSGAPRHAGASGGKQPRRGSRRKRAGTTGSSAASSVFTTDDDGDGGAGGGRSGRGGSFDAGDGDDVGAALAAAAPGHRGSFGGGAALGALPEAPSSESLVALALQQQQQQQQQQQASPRAGAPSATSARRSGGGGGAAVRVAAGPPANGGTGQWRARSASEGSAPLSSPPAPQSLPASSLGGDNELQQGRRDSDSDGNGGSDDGDDGVQPPLRAALPSGGSQPLDGGTAAGIALGGDGDFQLITHHRKGRRRVASAGGSVLHVKGGGNSSGATSAVAPKAPPAQAPASPPPSRPPSMRLLQPPLATAGAVALAPAQSPSLAAASAPSVGGSPFPRTRSPAGVATGGGAAAATLPYASVVTASPSRLPPLPPAASQHAAADPAATTIALPLPPPTGPSAPAYYSYPVNASSSGSLLPRSSPQQSEPRSNASVAPAGSDDGGVDTSGASVLPAPATPSASRSLPLHAALQQPLPPPGLGHPYAAAGAPGDLFGYQPSVIPTPQQQQGGGLFAPPSPFQQPLAGAGGGPFSQPVSAFQQPYVQHHPQSPLLHQQQPSPYQQQQAAAFQLWQHQQQHAFLGSSGGNSPGATAASLFAGYGSPGVLAAAGAPASPFAPASPQASRSVVGGVPWAAVGPIAFPAAHASRQLLAVGPAPGTVAFRGRHGRFPATVVRVDPLVLPLPQGYLDALAGVFDGTGGTGSSGGDAAGGDGSGGAAHLLRFLGDEEAAVPLAAVAAGVVPENGSGGGAPLLLALEAYDCDLRTAVAPPPAVLPLPLALAPPFAPTPSSALPSLATRIEWCRQLALALAALRAAPAAASSSAGGHAAHLPATLRSTGHGGLCPHVVVVRGGALKLGGPPGMVPAGLAQLAALWTAAAEAEEGGTAGATAAAVNARCRLAALARAHLAAVGPWLPAEAHAALGALADADATLPPVTPAQAAAAVVAAFALTTDVFGFGCLVWFMLTGGGHPLVAAGGGARRGAGGRALGAGATQPASSAATAAGAVAAILGGHTPLDPRLRAVTLRQAVAVAANELSLAAPSGGGRKGSTAAPAAPLPPPSPHDVGLPLEARDLVAGCVAPAPGERPSLAAAGSGSSSGSAPILRHPLFWSRRQAVDFIAAFSDAMKRRYGSSPSLPPGLLPQAAAAAAATGGGPGAAAPAVLVAAAPPWAGVACPAPELVYLEHAYAWHEGGGADWAAKLAAVDARAGPGGTARVWRTGTAVGVGGGGVETPPGGASDVAAAAPPAQPSTAAALPSTAVLPPQQQQQQQLPVHVPAEEHKSPANYFWAYARKRGLYGLGIVRAVRNIASAHGHDYVADGTFPGGLEDARAYFLDAFPWLLLEVREAWALVHTQAPHQATGGRGAAAGSSAAAAAKTPGPQPPLAARNSY